MQNSSAEQTCPRPHNFVAHAAFIYKPVNTSLHLRLVDVRLLPGQLAGYEITYAINWRQESVSGALLSQCLQAKGTPRAISFNSRVGLEDLRSVLPLSFVFDAVF